MATIHYFPRYSQKENMVTNNTLLLFSRLYNSSPQKFTQFINALLEESGVELETMVRFKQQQRIASGRIPDGIIEQESFKVVIETKLYGQETLKQVKGHWKAFDSEDKQIFLWINREPISSTYHQRIIKALNQHNEESKSAVAFASTTFKNICRCFNDTLQVYDLEMKALIDDYETFCSDAKLLDNADSKIRVVLTGHTFQQNLQYNLYYNPVERGYQNTKYLGLYRSKAVQAVGEITCIADVKYHPEDDRFEVRQVVQGDLCAGQIETMKRVTIESKELYGYASDDARRFFFVREYHKTNYLKASKGGLMGGRYIDLTEVQGYRVDMTAADIAELLRNKPWEIG